MLTCLKMKFLTLDKIKIRCDFVLSPPSPEKLIRKTAEFVNGAKLEPILIDKDYNLIDGYCSYLIAKNLNSRKYKIVMVKEKNNDKETIKSTK